jgi:hypothetical protein
MGHREGGCAHARPRRSDEAQRGPQRERRPQGIAGFSGRERGDGGTAIVCESLVARNRVLRSADLHEVAGPWEVRALKGVLALPDGVALSSIWRSTDWLMAIEAVPDNVFESAKC